MVSDASSADNLANGVGALQITDRTCTGVLCSQPLSRDIRSRPSEPHQKPVKKSPPPKKEGESDGEEEAEEGAPLCGACGDNYTAEIEFWICCDICERWFHGKCVKITPAQAEHIMQYKCSSCSTKRAY